MSNSTYTLRRISELLGYSMLSSFSRWFSAEFGVAPIVWRARHARRRSGRDKMQTASRA
jgi:AraC-like DNA-binding protein